MRWLLLLTVLLAVAGIAGAGQEAVDQTPAAEGTADPPHIIARVEAEGSCAIEGMGQEQGRIIALRRARASAIAQAGGGTLTGDTRVTDERLTVDFIKAYSEGYIVKEKVWEPLPGEYRKDESSAPVPEYRVKIMAEVRMPRRKTAPIGLDATMNAAIFRDGQKPEIVVNVGREVRIALFRITAEDRVFMIFPNEESQDNEIIDGMSYIFPSEDESIDMSVRPVPGHGRDTEAVFISVMDRGQENDFRDIFRPLEPMELSAFFSRYAEVADYCEDTVLAYEVVGE